jgi:hypothetical protein
MPAKRATGKKAAAKVMAAGLMSMIGGPAAAKRAISPGSIIGSARSVKRAVDRPPAFVPRKKGKNRTR